MSEENKQKETTQQPTSLFTNEDKKEFQSMLKPIKYILDLCLSLFIAYIIAVALIGMYGVKLDDVPVGYMISTVATVFVGVHMRTIGKK